MFDGGALHHRVCRLLICLEVCLRARFRCRIGVLSLSAKRRRKIPLEQLIAKSRVDVQATHRGELLVFLFRLRYAVISRVVILANSGLVRRQPGTAVEESRSRRIFNHFLELQQRTHLACRGLCGIRRLLVTQHTLNRGHLPKIRRIERLRRKVTPREQNDSRSLKDKSVFLLSLIGPVRIQRPL